MAEPNSENPSGSGAERPNLVSLPGAGAAARPSGAPEAPGAGAPPEPTAPRRWLVVAGALLGLCLLGLAIQTQRVATRDARIAELSSRVEGLEGRLAGANARLAAYDTQLERIRSSVAGLVEQLGALAEIVEEEPAPPATPPAEAP